MARCRRSSRSLEAIRSHYDVLGVPRRADAAAIRVAYRERARMVHPDRAATGSADEMAAVNEAYRVLSDAGRRAVYDRALDGGHGTGSAVPPSSRSAGMGDDDADVLETLRRTSYNYQGQLEPARVPWRFLVVLAVIGISSVLIGAALIDGPTEQQPDGIIRSGSCVEILPNTDAREVACTGEGDLVVDELIPIDDRCRGGTSPHRDQLGRGLACVLPPTPATPTTSGS